MAEIQDRHRKGAQEWADKKRFHDTPEARLNAYAQALADVEDLNGYDLTACRAAYALVCEAIVPGAGSGGAGAMAMSVQLLRRRAEKAESRVRELENRMTGHIGDD